MRSSHFFAFSLGLITSLASAPDAHAIAPYTRTTNAACSSCHVVYNRLTPLGEAFRRNGHRMPQAWAALSPGEEISEAVDIPLSLGFGGAANAYPHRSADAAKGKSVFDMEGLAAYSGLRFGRGLTDTITAYVSAGSSGFAPFIDEARIYFTDLGGAPHVFNVWVGAASPQLTSFGSHASYFGGNLIPQIVERSDFATTSGVNDSSGGIEFFGIAAQRFGYSLGVQGTLGGDTSTPYAYGRVAYKVGGLSLDGEDGLISADEPWEETALTIDVFGGYMHVQGEIYPSIKVVDDSWIVGSNLDGQLGAFNLDVGAYVHAHGHGPQVTALFAEASCVFTENWVAALRADHVRVGDYLIDTRLVPGIVWAPFAHTSFGLSAQTEWPFAATPDAPGGYYYDYADPLTFNASTNAPNTPALQMLTLWFATSL